MKRKHYKELWKLRFQKMRSTEAKMYKGYGTLISKCDNLPKPESVKKFIKSTLEKIRKDELKHAGLVEKLIEILKRQPD